MPDFNTPWNRLSPRERYESDPVFHQLVTMLYAALEQDENRTYTPTELREAAMLAALMYEERHVKPFFLKHGF
jgi:hypothetical protein